jgi:UbiD family decarboxylase
MVACHASAYCNRWTIVLDEDTDPGNINEVTWAMCPRCNPRNQVDVIDVGWNSALDPICYDSNNGQRNSRVSSSTPASDSIATTTFLPSPAPNKEPDT